MAVRILFAFTVYLGLLLGLASLHPPGQPSAERSPARLPLQVKRLRTAIQHRVDEGKLASVFIAVVKDGEVAWQETFGWEDKEAKIKATPQTVYALGSLSKSITATGVLGLVQEGRIKLDQPVIPLIAPRRVRFFRGKPEDLTVRRVLNMTGGIPHGWACYPPGRIPASAAFFARTALVVFPPGGTSHYANNSYAIAGQLVESCSGSSFSAFMDSRVFRPLGMTRTWVGWRKASGVAGMYDATGKRLKPYDFSPAAAAGMWSSGHDLIRYAMFHLGQVAKGEKVGSGHPLLSRSLLDQMHFERPRDVPAAVMALGWGSAELESGLRWLVSNGSVHGGTSALFLLPDHRLAVICLTNSTSNGAADEVASEALDAWHPGFKAKLEKGIKAFQGQHHRGWKRDERVNGQWTGHIDGNGGSVPVTLDFSADDNVLARVRRGKGSVVEGLRWEAGFLTGSFKLMAPMDGYSEGVPDKVELCLLPEKEEMHGYASFVIPGEYGSFSFPAYIRLRRSGQADGD